MPKPIDMSSPNPKVLNTIERSMLENEVIEALRSIYDPEIPVNIYDLGLIYNVSADENGFVTVTMTLTSPACPVAESLPIEVQEKIKFVPGVTDAKVDLTWDPPFTLDMVSDEVKLMLGLL